MPFYFVNSRTPSGLRPPLAGEEFADIEAVRLECAIGAKRVVADALQNNETLDEALVGSFEVTDGDGAIVLIMPFADAVQIDTRHMRDVSEIVTRPESVGEQAT